MGTRLKIRITRSARRHRIGNAHILAAMRDAGRPTSVGDRLVYVGEDDRAVELVVIAVRDDRRSGGLAVIHAIPAEWHSWR
jgi:hypothetical protein